jgi:hypothetical protein
MVRAAIFERVGSCVGAVLAVVLLDAAPAQTQTANPNQVAILRWYKANQAAEFPAGNGAIQLAFDGANIWVANNSAASVSKR